MSAQPVDVLAVLALAGEALDHHELIASKAVTRADADEARAAVAELVEAARDMRDCLRILRDDYHAEPEDLAALARGENALARCGGA